jgi:hypothetical protein
MAIHDTVAATLAEMGLPVDHSMRTILIRDGYFVGHKYHFDDGWATWQAQTNTVEVYDGNGKLLRTVAMETINEETAA